MAATSVDAAANYLSPITESVAKGNATGLGDLLKLGDAVGGLGGGLGSLIRSLKGDSSSSSSGMDLGDPFDSKYADLATEKVNTEYAKLLQQLGGIANDIAYLTGNTVPDAVQEFRNRYKAYIEPAAQRGYNQLYGFDPNAIGPISLEEYGDKATNKMFDTMNKFSSINRQNFMDVATNPETVEIDPNIYQKQFNKYMDESNKKLMDYSGEQTQDLISGAGSPGSRYNRKRMAGFFADSPEVARLMDFSA